MTATNWNLVLDSSSNLDDADLGGGIARSIVPMKIIIDSKEFIDNAKLDVADMMRKMKESKTASSSACPSVGEFAERFRAAKNTICITLTSALSGTYDVALQAKALVLSEDPSRNIHVVDSCGTGGKLALIAEEAERLIREGTVFDEVVKRTEAHAKNIKLLFSLASFDNLIKNGRMPKYQGMLGQILRVRPVAEATDEGTIEVLDKPRGENAMLRTMVERMQGFKNLEGVRIIIDCCDSHDIALKLKEKIEAVANVKDVRLTSTRGLCSYYTDEKGFIVSF
ncbi:MAG: DegV family protein [Coriobacteriia bacterium]|nr:DegV family protein [Coriobacteriia bacterium]